MKLRWLTPASSAADAIPASVGAIDAGPPGHEKLTTCTPISISPCYHADYCRPARYEGASRRRDVEGAIPEASRGTERVEPVNEVNLYAVYLGGDLAAGRMGEDHEVVF